jgi:SNF2 family DNA or RNA helicase
VIATLIDATTIALLDAYRQKDACAALDGARWSPALKAWLVDATAANIASIAALTPLPDELRALLPAAPPREVLPDDAAWLTRATPYEHQRQAVAAAMRAMRARGGFALLMEMGCGKTLAALEVVSRLHAAGDVRRVLVVAPGSVVPVWTREVAQYMGMIDVGPPEGYIGYLAPVPVAELLGSKPKREAALQALSGPLQIAVVNYESAWRLPALAAWRPDMVIADESQRIKGHSTRQTKGVTALGRAAHYRLALSGTPVTNGPLDVFAQWRFLDASIFGDSFYAFRARYAIMGGFQRELPNGHKVATQVVGYTRLDELTAKVHAIAYRVSKADALDLPETTDTIVPVALSHAERAAYSALERDSVAAFESGECSVTNVLTRLLRLSQVAGGSVPRDDGGIEPLGTSKHDAVVEVVEDAVSGGDKVVVFCRFRAEIAALMAAFPGCVALHGGVAASDRGEVVRAFQEDEQVRVMVAQLQVGGAGITLHAASTMVFSSLSFSFGDYEQAKARIHRIGQTRPCTYVHIIATGTVDETIMDAMRTKRDVASLVVDRGYSR